jgi:hypothetical protein
MKVWASRTIGAARCWAIVAPLAWAGAPPFAQSASAAINIFILMVVSPAFRSLPDRAAGYGR